MLVFQSSMRGEGPGGYQGGPSSMSMMVCDRGSFTGYLFAIMDCEFWH